MERNTRKGSANVTKKATSEVTRFLFEKNTHFKDYFITFLRVISGLFFVNHGIGLFDQEKIAGFANWFGTEHNAPFPLLMAYLRYGSEFFGGVMLVVGLFTRAGALLIFATMMVATLTVHLHEIMGEGELALVYAAIMLTIALTGPGKLSIDRIIANTMIRDN